MMNQRITFAAAHGRLRLAYDAGHAPEARPAGSPIRTIVYGADAAGRAARARLARDPSRSVLAFADEDSRKQGTIVDGLRVIAIEGLPQEWYDEVVVASPSWRELAAALAKLGVERSRIFRYQPGDAHVTRAFDAIERSARVPSVLVLTDESLSPATDIGAVLMQHFDGYDAGRLTHVYLRRAAEPFWPKSYALAVNGRGEAGSLTASSITAQLAASGEMPDVIYSTMSGEPGLEALGVLLETLGPVPVIQHFHDWQYADLRAFERTLCTLGPSITELWASTAALSARLSRMTGRDVRTVSTLTCQPAPSGKREHRDLDERFRVVMLGNCPMPWVLHHVRNVWRRIRQEVPGLGPIQWYGYPTAPLDVREAGVEFEPEIEYYGYLNSRALHEHLCAADLALVPVNVEDEPEYPHAAWSLPARATELFNAGLPIVAAAGRGTEARRFLTAEGLAVCGTIADEAAFAATLLEVMRNTATRLALGARARDYAKRQCDVAAYRQSLMAALARCRMPNA